MGCGLILIHARRYNYCLRDFDGTRKNFEVRMVDDLHVSIVEVVCK